MILDRDKVVAALPAYEIGNELGRGAFGVVLNARHRQLGREVAIKQLPRAFGADPAVRARFAAEAKLLASLDHPHIVPVYDYVESEGLCLLVMEKLSGGTVWSRFTSEGLTPEAACAMVLAACSGLHSAHQRGILHRDVKPQNLMFAASGTLKVTDFGLAKMLGGDETMATRAGEVLGTPAYMAPEQAQGEELGPPTDVYSVGVLLYELLSGHLPFADDGDALATLYRHVYEEPEPLGRSAPQTPQAVADAVMKAMATKPEDRHPTAEEFGVALAEAATGAWGPGWPIARGNIALMGSSSIVSASERITSPMPTAPGPGTMSPVRATRETVPKKSVPDADDAGTFMPLQEVLSHPKFPARTAAIAVAFLLIGALVGGLGIGSPAHSNSLPPGVMLVNNQDAVAGQAVLVDLEQPLDVLCKPGVFAGPDPPNTVRVDLYIAGVELGSVTAPISQRPDRYWQASIDAADKRYLAGGTVTADMTVLTASQATLGTLSFPLKSERSPFLALPGVVSIITLLFLVSYAESVMRLMSKGRRGPSAIVSMVILGAGIGLILASTSALIGGRELGAAMLAISASLGACGGFFLGRWGALLGRYRRMAQPRPA